MHDHHDDDHRDTAAPHAGPGPTDGDVRGAHDEREAADHDHDHRHTRRTLVGVAGAVGPGAMLSQLGVAGGCSSAWASTTRRRPQPPRAS
jgi:hypothetical protein